MRLRECFLVATLMSFSLVMAKAGPPLFSNYEVVPDFVTENNGTTKPIPTVSVPPAPSTLITEDKLLRAAYYDALSILSTSNLCTEFFGGPTASIEVFNQLMGRMRKDYLSGTVAMLMTGQTTNMRNVKTNNEYRLFEKVQINANGPFYRNRFSTSNPSVPPIGTFEPNTRQARVLILLHELGHVVKGQDGKWLLPNDGNDTRMSILNTQRIENVCGDQIKGLAKSETKTLLAEKEHTNENPASASAKP